MTFNPVSWCHADLCVPDIQDYLKHKDIILIPIGAIEQHGLHLPLITDAAQGLEVARRAAAKARVLYTPVLWFGYSPHHLGHVGEGTGTITLRASTLHAIISDMVRSLLHSGFKHFVIVNNQGSNIKVMDAILRKLRYDTGAFICMTKLYGERYMGLVKEVMENPPEETPGWHSSELETSRSWLTTKSSCGWIAPSKSIPMGPSGCRRNSTRTMVCRRSASKATSISVSPWSTGTSPTRGQLGIHSAPRAKRARRVSSSTRITWPKQSGTSRRYPSTFAPGCRNLSIAPCRYFLDKQVSGMNAARPLGREVLLSEVADIVGVEDVTVREVDRLAYAQDYFWLGQMWLDRGEQPCRPDLICYPGSADEVSRLLKVATRFRIPVIPYGGGSGTQGGVAPLYGGMVIDLKKLNRMLRLDERSLTATVEGGMNQMHLEEALNGKGLTWPHYPASGPVATVGGSIAARGTGTLSTKYGKAEDMVLSLKVVLADGRIIETLPTPNHACGRG